MKSRLLGAVVALLLGTVPSPSRAQGIVVDFNAVSPGTVVGDLGGVGFRYAPDDFRSSGFPLVVSSGFASSSGRHYLGVQDGRSQFFQPGDGLALTLAAPVDRLAVSFIVPKTAPDGAFGLSAASTSVTSTSANRVMLPTGDSAYTVHLVSPSPFTSASVFSDASSAPAFSIDDIVVPEPESAPLVVGGVVALGGLARTRTRRRR
ncbi:MAG: hypothetical protein R3F35_09355 [Myxococcota bacterium]